MKNRNNVFTATLVALAFVLGPGADAQPRPDGGPTKLPSPSSAKAINDGGSKPGMPDDILPTVVRIEFAPVGLTVTQTARLNLVNMDVPNGISVSCRFIDASGFTLAQSVTTLSVGKTTSVDYKRQPITLTSGPPDQLRAEVRVELDLVTYGVSNDSLRRSLEVFDSNTGATTVYMGGGDS
jgi:hypothetical protein